jgi:hypothetical protein
MELTDAKRANNLEEVARIQEQLAELDGPVILRRELGRNVLLRRGETVDT